jgi:hypothetical protein
MDDVAILDPWSWAARDKARQQKPFVVNAPTYTEAQRVAAHRLGFYTVRRDSGELEFEVGKVEVRVLSLDEIEKLRSREAA